MEFIDGETLDVWQRDPELGWSEILQVYLAAARGLAAAHDAGIVHRDFKPANVMRSREGRVVVLDFGLARHTDAEAFDEVATQVRDPSQSSVLLRARIEAIRAAESKALPEHLATPLTATGAVMGTPAYMSPEQHEGLPTDHRTDQFSLCVSLWEGLYGERPFEGQTLALLTSAVLEGRVRKVPEYSTQVPTYVQDGLMVGSRHRARPALSRSASVDRSSRSRPGLLGQAQAWLPGGGDPGGLLVLGVGGERVGRQPRARRRARSLRDRSRRGAGQRRALGSPGTRGRGLVTLGRFGLGARPRGAQP